MLQYDVHNGVEAVVGISFKGQTMIITEDIKQQIRDYYTSKPMSLSHLSKKFGYCVPTVRKALGDIPIYSKTMIYNPNLNEHYFDVIDTEKKAYFVGLIIADGNIFDPSNSAHPGEKWVSITLQDSDRYILEEFKKELGASTKVSSDGRGSSYIAIRSNKLADALAKLGIVPCKSFNTEMPQQIPPELIPHLIRGIIDGDGSIQTRQTNIRNRFKHSISCCGTHKLMSQMTDVISSICMLEHKPKVYDYKSKQLSEFSVCKIPDMKKFGDWMYTNATVFLIRKYKHYLDFLTHYEFDTSSLPVLY